MIRNLSLWISGFLVAIGLMVIDEVLTLARYCGPDCVYEMPFNLFAVNQYDAESLSWIFVITGFALVLFVKMQPIKVKP